MAISYGRTDIETPIHADIKENIKSWDHCQ